MAVSSGGNTPGAGTMSGAAISGANAGGPGGNIKVVVRVRPFNNRELERNAKCIVQMKGAQTVLKPPAQIDGKVKSNKAVLDGAKTFAFDKSYWSFNRDDPTFAGQEDLFADLGRPLLDNAFQGYNNCIFAYGQTGSGKSYSMMGYGPDEGVIPKICRDMFDRIAQIQKDPNLTCTVEVSYLEIYNERVRDLLNPATKGNLKVREHPSTGPYVEDLAKLAVRSFPEIENLMDEGNKARTVAATNMNETSSRSHAVFTLTLTQKRHDVETNMDTEKVAKISLVDLAGSERATSTGATGARLKEGAEINRSLSTLGRVIAALADLSTGKKKTGSLVPYRDSVLTWLLKDSLGGNSLTAMIAAISPADINFEETLSTLRYADSAKRIRNHAVVNEDPNARMIRELKEELAQLRAKLEGGHIEGGSSEHQYPEGTPLDQQFVSITQADGTLKQVSKAEIMEQLGQSEKLYQDLNQTWEQKLQNTEKVHKEREAALEELGISIEKGFVGMSTPKRMPHLVNLSDDPLLDECLVYNLKPGLTTVGNVEGSSSADINLNGTKILDDHCIFENVDGVVTVVPRPNAAVMVNGVRLDQPKRLRTGYRIILGDFHIFRFNHPEEARAERADQGSRLKHSIAADDFRSPSPSLRPGRERQFSNVSRTESEAEQARNFSVSPIPYRGGAAESDWSLARREAVTAVLGSDEGVNGLNDDQLEVLFEDLQRVRAIRKGRPESRLLDGTPDDETDSVASGPLRGRLLSNGHKHTPSVDTVLTIPSTQHRERASSQENDHEERDAAGPQKQNVENDLKLQQAEAANIELEQVRAEKEQMENALRAAKAELQEQLQNQREEHQRQLASMNKKAALRSRNTLGLTPDQFEVITEMCLFWRRRRYITMAALMLEHAPTLKEAQIMSVSMNKSVVFQYAIADVGHGIGSMYDMVLDDTATDDDPELTQAPTPTIVVRVIDFKHCAVHLWSLGKLQARLLSMTQIKQYMDRPEYLQHFKVENPFSEAYVPQYTRIGDADIPLSAVFACRVQDFTLDVYSPFTFTVIGILRLSLEPSSAEAPPSTLKFNVVMHDFAGFPEREGTDVHAQLYFPGLPIHDEGATTTQMLSGFDEESVRFESVHSMSVSTHASPEATLRISLFARVTSMHLDKLLSWDDMRDSQSPARLSRFGPGQLSNEDKHDVFARLQMQEISEEGDYRAVEVVQTEALDAGAYQLHQGLQRRIVIEMTSTAGASVPWTDVLNPRIGSVQLTDSNGKIIDVNRGQADVPLHIVGIPSIRTNRDYTTNLRLVTQWDSGAHSSLLLNRSTAEGMRINMTVTWDMVSVRLSKPLVVSMQVNCQIRPRLWVRQQSLLSSIWTSERISRSSTAIYSLAIKPTNSNRSRDLWRLTAQDNYVEGEEALDSWAPRGVSLVSEYLDMHKCRSRAAEVEATRRSLHNDDDELDELLQLRPRTKSPSTGDLTPSQTALLQRSVQYWKSTSDPATRILARARAHASGKPSSMSPPARAPDPDGDYTPPRLLSATITQVDKSRTLLRAGVLLCPSAPAHEPNTTSSTPARWERRMIELRPPYMHVHAASGDQISAINLTRSRVDRDPAAAPATTSSLDAPAPSAAGPHARPTIHFPGAAFVLHTARGKAYTFVAQRGERERAEWLWAIDRAYALEDDAGGDPLEVEDEDAEALDARGRTGWESAEDDDDDEEEEDGRWGRRR